MLTHFVLIVVTAITWIIPIGTQAYRPSLHKRHNDEVYKVKVDQDFASRYLIGRRQFSREINPASAVYNQNNLAPYSAVAPLKREGVDVILQKIEELTTLVKIILIQSYDRDEKEKRKNRKKFLYKTDDPETDESESEMRFLDRSRSIESNEENSRNFASTEIVHGRIPYGKNDVTLIKKSRLENEKET